MALLKLISPHSTQVQCHALSRMDKEDVTYRQWDTTQIEKNNEIMLFAATWMQVEIITVKQFRERTKHRIISLICGIRNMTQMNLSTKQTQEHRDQTCACQGGGSCGREGLGGWG